LSFIPVRRVLSAFLKARARFPIWPLAAALRLAFAYQESAFAHQEEDAVAAPECIFCRIVAGIAPCEEVYRDSATLAFMDIHPVNEGHCLVIPRAHFATVFEMSPEYFAAVGATVAKLARAVNEALRASALNIVQANGELAGQTVSHVHVHVLPRRAGDNLLMSWDRNRTGDPVDADPVRLGAIAERIRARLARSLTGPCLADPCLAGPCLAGRCLAGRCLAGRCLA
jgi:histidine triad (HIT) family protein